MTPWNDALHVSFVVQKCGLFAVVCVLFASLQHFATSFEICGCDCCDRSIEISLARQSIHSVSQGGCWGRANHLDPGCSSVAFWQQRAVSPLWLGFASADVGWVIWIEVVITVVALSFNSSCFTAAEHCQMSTVDQNIVAGASLHVELLVPCTSALHAPLMLASPRFMMKVGSVRIPGQVELDRVWRVKQRTQA